ncbi:MAG: hypothetical protein HOW73_35640 [Polyangiaceae bacterium]|nr:hypothetical protein [Polyangiaceae bacterium]
MKSSEQMQRLHPAGLATLLDRWALRHEKVLTVLDIRAAREARHLAQACRSLATTERDGVSEVESWERDWRDVRLRAALLLDGKRANSPARLSAALADAAEETRHSSLRTRDTEELVAVEESKERSA